MTLADLFVLMNEAWAVAPVLAEFPLEEPEAPDKLPEIEVFFINLFKLSSNSSVTGQLVEFFFKTLRNKAMDSLC
ncbi:hypothetical protein WICPIJ_001491 [Wickerhamomyces pijperi]|uniref:Uncharacterized protein n=1 Tax=Wickerhamomyces pijperi TaxID=599730 RepID=A0A9P8TQR3_WICPI|nr:hypothetical protein WICPIJ_001491 [Wickerhamomyces pijperi]